MSYTRMHSIFCILHKETSSKPPCKSFVVSCGNSRHNKTLRFELFNTHVSTGTKVGVCESLCHPRAEEKTN